MTMKQTAESAVRVGKTSANGTSINWSERASRPSNGQRPERRYFSNDYKLSMLAEYDRCSKPGEKGALLCAKASTRRSSRTGAASIAKGRTRLAEEVQRAGRTLRRS
jgi:hypothetical protein